VSHRPTTPTHNTHPAAPATTTDELVQNAEAYAHTFTKGALTPSPARKVAVVTCMDARIDPARILGLKEGDAHVVRNAGGVVTDDMIRSLAISQHLLGTEEVLVIMHTGCGIHGLDNDAFHATLELAAGERPHWHASGFPDLEGEVRRSLRRIHESPFVPHSRVRGFVYDVTTGRLLEVL
jgi:carbonic anhydrase